MNNEKLSQVKLRKRKMMLVLPVLVIPFLTLAFYAMGGGSGKKEMSISTNEGLNLKLPEANLKEEKLMDKLSFYDKADKDSAKMAEWMRSDPYYRDKLEKPEPFTDELEEITENTASKYNQRLNVSPYEKSKTNPEDEVMKKISLLQKKLNNNSTLQHKETESFSRNISNPDFGSDVTRLENMINMMSEGSEEDPEIKQLSSVMDKILDIQHPDRVKDRLKEKTKTEASKAQKVSVISSDDTIAAGFFGMEKDAAENRANAIEAVVNENQILVNGAVIKLRLLKDVFVNNEKIPAGNFVYGVTALNGERLEIEVNSIRSNSSLYDVRMEVYDMDGLRGIHIPGAITRDVAKQSADNSLQMMELTTLDPSLKAQATTAGINTAKSLLSKKVKLVKVMVKAGYKILLKNKTDQQ